MEAMTNKEVKANIKEEVTLGIFFLECNACDKKLYNEGTEISSVLFAGVFHLFAKHGGYFSSLVVQFLVAGIALQKENSQSNFFLYVGFYFFVCHGFHIFPL